MRVTHAGRVSGRRTRPNLSSKTPIRRSRSLCKFDNLGQKTSKNCRKQYRKCTKHVHGRAGDGALINRWGTGPWRGQGSQRAAMSRPGAPEHPLCGEMRGLLFPRGMDAPAAGLNRRRTPQAARPGKGGARRPAGMRCGTGPRPHAMEREASRSLTVACWTRPVSCDRCCMLRVIVSTPV